MEFEKRNLTNKIFYGVVENVFDKQKKGRIQVRVQSIFNQIPLEHIPWASPNRSLNGKSFCVPAVGKLVSVIFDNGNIYEPRYIYSENNNTNLQQKLNDLSDDEYQNFVALLFDHRTQIYSDDDNLVLDYKFNKIAIKNDKINIELKDNNQKLNLGHKYAEQSVLLGNHFLDWFDELMKILKTPTNLIGNIGNPILKPNVDLHISKYFALKETFLSTHVKVVDNMSCLNTGEDRKQSPAQDDQTKINNDKLLESVLVDEKIKDEIYENRLKDNDELKSSEPDKKDLAYKDTDDSMLDNNDEPILDFPIKENIVSDKIETDLSTLNLTDEERLSIDKSKQANERENQSIMKEEKKEKIDDKPYSSFWTNRKSRPDDLYDYEPPVRNKTYGSYSTSSTDGTSYKQKKYGKKRTKKDGTLVENGKLDLMDLVELDGFTINGKPGIIYLEKNAAKAFTQLNEEFKKEFNKSIDVSGNNSHYRTFESQEMFWVKYKNGTGNLAARPGTSNHGWGLALDINGTYGGTSKYYKWLINNSIKYNIKRTIYKKTSKKTAQQSESWHWQYIGENIYKK